MIQAGFQTIDPFTGTKTTVIQGTEETGGTGWTLIVHCPEGAPPHILSHVHLNWHEAFDIVQGSARYMLAGKEFTAEAGDVIEMPAGLKHVHPWNDGSGTMIYRQKNYFGNVNPDAVNDIIGVFATINGMAKEGKIGAKGLPKNLLQFAATLRTLVKHHGYDAAIPISLQRFVSATLGRLAESMGYRGVYPRYLASAAAKTMA